MRTFSLGAGADTVVFGASKDANGVDTITNFTAGAGGDALDFIKNSLLTSAKFETFSTVSTSGAAIKGTADGVIVLKDVADLTGITFDSNGTSANKLGLKTNQKYVIITDKDGDNTAGNIYYVSAGATPTTATPLLIGTVMRDGDAGDYVVGNFTGTEAP